MAQSSSRCWKVLAALTLLSAPATAQYANKEAVKKSIDAARECVLQQIAVTIGDTTSSSREVAQAAVKRCDRHFFQMGRSAMAGQTPTGEFLNPVRQAFTEEFTSIVMQYRNSMQNRTAR